MHALACLGCPFSLVFASALLVWFLFFVLRGSSSTSEEKRLPFAACFQMLGAIVDLSEMPQGRIFVRNKPARLDDIAQLVEAILFRCCCSVFLVWLPSCFCPGGLGACGLARSLLVSLPPPWLSSGVFWSSQCSAGPSLRISGCICNGPVVIPLAWRVVTDWLLSSLRFMATKASALCGALPSTPCCGVVHVPLAPALKYSLSGDPESP